MAAAMFATVTFDAYCALCGCSTHALDNLLADERMCMLLPEQQEANGPMTGTWKLQADQGYILLPLVTELALELEWYACGMRLTWSTAM